jgi:SAM-dependent methyltransferase
LKRQLEPELMDDPEQALAYARADFSEENQGFVDTFREYYPDFASGHVLDLGCGPADIPIRFLRALPDCRVTGVDASAPMIRPSRRPGSPGASPCAAKGSRPTSRPSRPMPPSPTACCIIFPTRCISGTS